MSQQKQHGRKLVIQIPCFNEGAVLAQTLQTLPAQVEGYDNVEVLLIDDGSTDASVAIARACGVKHIVSHQHNLGLAQTFQTGLRSALALNAHTIVNFDADNQYRAQDIELLVSPILRGEAGVVIGTRPIRDMKQFSRLKKWLQYLGSFTIRLLSRTNVEDVASGFRAIHNEVAQHIVVHSRFSYTIEMVIQLGYRRNPIVCVPVGVNTVQRPSRLARNTWHYLARSLLDLIRALVNFRPLLFYSIASILLLLPVLGIAGHYFLFLFSEGDVKDSSRHFMALAFALASLTAMAIGFFYKNLKSRPIEHQKPSNERVPKNA